MKKLMLISILLFGATLLCFSQGEVHHLKKTGVFIAKYEGRYLRTYGDNPFVFTSLKKANADWFDSFIDAEELILKYHEQKTGEGVDRYYITLPDEHTEMIEFEAEINKRHNPWSDLKVISIKE